MGKLKVKKTKILHTELRVYNYRDKNGMLQDKNLLEWLDEDSNTELLNWKNSRIHGFYIKIEKL